MMSGDGCRVLGGGWRMLGHVTDAGCQEAGVRRRMPGGGCRVLGGGLRMLNTDYKYPDYKISDKTNKF
jgi:hypothetical protein